MKVTFTYRPLSGTGTTALVLALGQRLSPAGPMQFDHTGAAQAVQAVRAEETRFLARGQRFVTERFTAQIEHSDYWAAVVWSRVTLAAALGKSGTLEFMGDRGGSIRLIDCVFINASGHNVGLLTMVDCEFSGGKWTS